MDRCSERVQESFGPVDGPPATHEHEGYHMDLKDRPAPATSLVCEIVHEGGQADAMASQETENGFYHVRQYPRGTLEPKW